MAQFFGISPAIRFVLSANEHFYPQIRGSLKPQNRQGSLFASIGFSVGVL
ncbi:MULTISPECIES: hypothetical protein [unclassified Vibrio]|nr:MULTISPECIES: hypothetical protein [unclassified Vibrio]